MKFIFLFLYLILVRFKIGQDFSQQHDNIDVMSLLGEYLTKGFHVFYNLIVLLSIEESIDGLLDLQGDESNI